jgi:H+/Cl- antiporter ClcA
MKWINVTMLVLWIIVGLFFGIGGIVNIQSNNIKNDKHKLGITDDTIQHLNAADTNSVIYDGITFKNKRALTQYLNSLPSENFSRIYSLFDNLPDFMGQIITAFAFGLLGSVIRIILGIAYHSKKIEDVSYISQPLLGMLTGLVVMGISYVIPNLLSKNAVNIDPISLMFFSLFAGIYNKEFYERLHFHFINKILSK